MSVRTEGAWGCRSQDRRNCPGEMVKCLGEVKGDPKENLQFGS